MVRLLAGICLYCLVCNGAAQAQATRFSFDGLGAVGSPAAQLRDTMANRLNEISNGQLQPTRSEASTFRSEMELIEGVVRDSLQVSIVSDSTLLAYVPSWAALRFPYLFDRSQQIAPLYDQCMRADLERAFHQAGLELVGRVDSGWQAIYSVHSLRGVADARKAFMRRPLHPVSRQYLDLAGMTLRDVPYSAIASSLEAGIIDAGEFTLLELASLPELKSVRHVLLTRHALSTGAVIANLGWFNGLTALQQQQLKDALGDPAVFTAYAEPYRSAFLGRAAAAGIEIHEPTRAQAENWRKALKSSWPQLMEGVSTEARTMIECAIGKVVRLQ